MSTPENTHTQLTRLLCDVSDPELMQAVLDALLTPKELQEVDNRIQIFQMLAEHLSQREIAERLNVGIATVTRGAQAYRSSPLFDIAPDILVRLQH